MRGWLRWSALLVIPAAVLGWTAWTADAGWSSMAREVEAGVAATRAELAADRAPVFGTALEGDAWPGYVDALAAPRVADPQARAALVASLLDATRRHRVGRPFELPDFDSAGPALEFVELGRLLAAAEGVPVAERCAATLRLGRDVATSAVTLVEFLVGCTVAGEALDALGRAVVAGDVPAADRPRLAAFLAEVDAAWPDAGTACHRERLASAAAMLRAYDDGDLGRVFGVRRILLWRDLFSERRLALRWWEHSRAVADATAAADHLRWPAARTRLDALEVPDRGDPLGMLTYRVPEFAEAARGVRARLRVVGAALADDPRAAAAAHPDPFGTGALRSADDGRVWSCGPDGIDDGGTGWLVDGADADLAIAARPR